MPNSTRQTNHSHKIPNHNEKIKQIRKTMDKENNKICKKALFQGQSTCAGGDLLTECIYSGVKNSTFGASRVAFIGRKLKQIGFVLVYDR